MAAPVINNLILPKTALLVLPDDGEQPTTGVVVDTPIAGSSQFYTGTYDHPADVGSRVLFVREMTTEVEIDEVEYLAMPVHAIVGLITGD